MREILLLAALVLPALHADVCDPRQFGGTYGFQLSGTTTISGDAKPTVSVGRLVFDGTGNVTGYASAHFAGYLQGNPTTGTYEAHSDCSVGWSLQDDSGAFQHFRGTMAPGGARVEFRQTDRGGPTHGVMARAPKVCGNAAFQPQYRFSISGSFTPMIEGQQAHTVSLSGTANVSGAGKLLFDLGDQRHAEGTYDVDSDCVATIGMTLESGDTVNLRGMLVDQGREILGMATDAGATVTAHFTAPR